MRVAVPRKVQMIPLLHLLLLAVMATLAAGIISTDGGRHPAASASSGPVVVATVAVGDMPYAVVVNPNTNRIYVANNNDNTVSVIEDVPSPTPTPTPTPTDTFTPTPTEVGQGTPTPTPNLSFQSNATPTDGTYVVPPVPVSYSLTVSNVGETEADSVILQVDTVDINPASFQSTHGTCTWTSGPDYHGHGIGQCDLGALAPAGGPEPSSALITLSGDVFWNFYSHGGAWIRFTSSPSGQGVGGVSWLFGTPTPTDNPTPRPTDTPTPTPTADLPDLVVTYMETTFEGGGDCGWSGTPLGTRVWVKNQGSADAGAFVVEFESSQLTVSSGLAAGQTTSVWFPVYVYEGSATATADATFLVAESDEDNNSLSQQLPFPTPPATCTPTPTSTPTVTPTATASGGSISGTVTDCQGNPLHDCEVDVVSWDGNGSSGWSLASADGSFVVTSLAPDNYRVEVRCQGYVQEYYPGVCDWQDAAPVAVLEGVNAPNVDFELSPVGDVNGDCQVSMVDPMLIAQCVAGLIDCDRLNLCAADANCGGSVSMVDAMLVAQKVAGLITDFPACGP